MGKLNNIFNSVKIISEGSNYNTTGLTVTTSGSTALGGGSTSFIVRDTGYVGVGTGTPGTGWGPAAANPVNLHVVGNARIENLPNGGKFFLTSDIFGNLLKTSNVPVVTTTGDCRITTAFTQNCILWLVSNCSGTTNPTYTQGGVTYEAFTADTCHNGGSSVPSPYTWGLGAQSITTTLPGNPTSSPYSTVGGGVFNNVGVNSQYSRIGGGFLNSISAISLNSDYSTILNGFLNSLTDSRFSFVGSGAINLMTESYNSTILGGMSNYTNNVMFSSIVGGANNQIYSANSSTILGGMSNTIYSGSFYSAIVNGEQNVLSHIGAAIIGANTLTSIDSYTTHMRGLNVNTTDLGLGAKWFKYHGTNASEGIGKFLVDIDGTGTAQWSNTRFPTTGDCQVASAFTNNCILWLVTNCTGSTWPTYTQGGVTYQAFTADTCTDGGINGPYIFKGGVNSISTALPIPGPSENYVGPNAHHSNIGGGAYNSITDIDSQQQTFNTINGGFKNKITGTDRHWNIIGAGYNNIINGGLSSFIGGGKWNVMSGTSNSIVGGDSNSISGNWSIVGGGKTNKIYSLTSYSGIFGGTENVITTEISQGANYSFIGGGEKNYILNATHSAIVNGFDNKILRAHDYSAIIGASGLTTTRDHTTFMSGLDVDTDTGASGWKTRYFRYHGGATTPGSGKVLTDVTGLGDAQWKSINGSILISGDCVISSAYTLNCVLWAVTNCTGDTAPGRILVNGYIAYTAETCGSFSDTPYRYSLAGGIGSIETRMFGSFNDAGSGGQNSILGGGWNTIDGFAARAAILNGSGNMISGSAVQGTLGSWIGAGAGNYISGSTFGHIGSGYYNKLMSIDGGIPDSAIVSGKYNIIERIAGAVFDSGENLIGAGAYNRITNSADSVIVAGTRNIIYNSGISPTNYGGGFIGSGSGNTLGNSIQHTVGSSILGGASNTISSDASIRYAAIVNGRFNTVGHNYSAIIGGQGLTSSKSHTTYMNALDVDTDITGGGTRYFKYHGTDSNTQIPAGQVLMNIDGLGNSQWTDIGIINNTLTGDCVIASAYTTNNSCTLWAVTSCTGDTAPGRLLVNGYIAYTADTCGSFNITVPYMYGLNGGIQTRMPGSGPTANRSQASYATVGGGMSNHITVMSTASGIFAGYDNTVSASTFTIIGAGYNNETIRGQESIIGAGRYNYIGNKQKSRLSADVSQYSGILGGYANEIWNGISSTISNGQFNIITGSTSSFIGAGTYNKINTTYYSSIQAGSTNAIYTSSNYGTIGGGVNNILKESSRYSAILNGENNTIRNSMYSSILAGKNNLIYSDGGVQYAAIVNGTDNTIAHHNSAIIGAVGITTNNTYTTFTNGLNIFTDPAAVGSRYMRYHGASSNSGTIGDVLTSFNTFGDAIWASNTSPGVNWTGDCVIASAYTTNDNCTLWAVTSCSGDPGAGHLLVYFGGVGYISYTANTCNNTFNGGPYTVGSGVNTIRPKIGFNQSETLYSNIQGGFTNKILTGTTADPNAYCSILGGVYNTITGSSVSTILSGQQNKIYIGESGMHGYGAILNGYNNQVRHHYSVIMGGAGITTDREFTVFMRGLDVNTTETDPFGPTQELPFRYHGGFATDGVAGDVLTEVDTLGNAAWRTPPWVTMLTDQYIVSATSVGCILTLYTNSGNTVTADTCTTFGGVSPYMFNAGGGIDSIEPAMPGAPSLHNRARSLFSSIMGGQSNKIFGTNALPNTGGYSFIGGGRWNMIWGNPPSYYSSITGGILNNISASTTSHIVGGQLNKILDSANSFIGGGAANHVKTDAHWSSVVGGAYNTISGASRAVIVNGQSNTIHGGHDYSAIIGGRSLSSSNSHTTYMNGLDVATNSTGGQRPFRYHGTYAQEGNNKLLMSDASGNAQWKESTFISWSGSCNVISAFTDNCTLWLVTNCTGSTWPLYDGYLSFTADTCNSGGSNVPSPYQFRGVNSISTVVPASGTVPDNFINGNWNNIQGGTYNKVNTIGQGHSGILGGYKNIIGSSNVASAMGLNPDFSIIAGGYNNRLSGIDQNHMFIGGGRENQIRSHASSIVGGEDNIITGTTAIHKNNIIGGGLSNKIDESTESFIGAGLSNYISLSDESTIVGGHANRLLNSDHSIIAGGRSNTIEDSTEYTGIFNGVYNTVAAGHDYSVIIGASGLTTTISHTTFMNGLDVDTDTGASGWKSRYFRYHGGIANPGVGKVLTDVDGTGNAVWASQGPPVLPGDEYVVSAYTTGCTITFYTNSGNTFTADTCNGAYSPYRPTGINSIVPTLPNINAAGENIIDASSLLSNVGGGRSNRIIFGSDRSIVAGGENNRIQFDSDYSNIAGGVHGIISGSSASTILGGNQNRVTITGLDMGYGTVINGYRNEVTNQYSVIMGGANMTTDRDFTVFMRGLDVNTTEPAGGWVPGPAQELPFRYHGGFAQGGITGIAGRVLTDSDGAGNAVWATTAPNISWTGDQFVVSAYTVECLLYIVTNSGNTFTADTCNNYTPSPYEYGGGLSGNIVPKLPSWGTNKNYIEFTNPAGTGNNNNIAGGHSNRILDSVLMNGAWDNAITGGIQNAISGGTSNIIGSGYLNTIYNGSLCSIEGGFGNKIDGPSLKQSASVGIFNGNSNIIRVQAHADTTGSVILGGNNNIISASTYCAIIGGGINSIIGGKTRIVILGSGGVVGRIDDTTYMSHLQAYGNNRLSSVEYLTTNGLLSTKPTGTLDVVHDDDSIEELTASEGTGEIVRFGSAGAGYVKGSLVRLGSTGSWALADADEASNQGNMLGIALGEQPTNGILIRGFLSLDTVGSDITAWSKGGPLYVSTVAGKVKETVPTGVGNYVRAIGYMLNWNAGTLGEIYFNPDSTYIVVQ